MREAEHADVLIVGGAIVGSAAATFLALRPDWHGRIVVVERDLTYRTSSTTLSAAAIRQQFSTPLNIEISQFGIELITHLADWLAVPGRAAPQIDFVEGGYLFLATPAGLPALEANHAVQRAHDVPVALLSPMELRKRFPWLHTDDLAAGSLGLAGEGWFDAHALLQAFVARARSLGVEYRAGEVVGLEVDAGRATSATLADGSRLTLEWLVNAAGPRAATVARLAGVDLPVHPRKRFVYHFDCRTRVEGAPLTVDPSGPYFRPEGPAYIGGASPGPDEPDPDALDLEVDRARFEERVWPALAHRVPAFEAIRLLDAWAGHYAVHPLDHNAILGPHPTITNLLFANGFSGHGLQQAPAVGRGLAEWIAAGRWETLDLSPLGYERILRGEPVRERNVV
jgi:sarcosine oxidase